MLAEGLMALASLAGKTLVTAAGTDTWEEAERGIARLLGRGDPRQEQLAKGRLEETREQLAGAEGAELEQVRAALAARWATRFADLLDDDTGVEADLRVLVQRIQKGLPADTVSATDRSVAAGREVNFGADHSRVAAGAIYGSVASAGPGSGHGVAGSGLAGLGAVFADRGPVAINRLEYQRKELARQPVRLAPRPQFLAGREKLLSVLHARLASHDDPRPRIVTLSGSGAGKTSVALEYAYRHLAEVGLAWQFPAQDPGVLRAGFGQLAAQLGAWDLTHTRDPVMSVHTVLAKFPAEWLLIFDNAPGPASVAAFLPPAGSGQVLITSQNLNWPGQALQVPGLDLDVAADFLISRTGDPDEQAAAELAGDLGGLPLALEQATAYVQATGQSLADYLALFRERRAELTVASTWALAVDRLQESEPGAVGLLQLLACCGLGAIPLDLLLQPRPGLPDRLGPALVPVLVPLLDDPLAAIDAIAALRRYSLVTPAADGSVSVHRLVQAVTVKQMPAELARQWRQGAAAVIEAAIPDDPRDPSSWPVFERLLPHAQAVLAADTDGMARVASYLGYSGSFAAARDLCSMTLEARERRYGPDHSDALTARAELAHWTGEAGDPAGARNLYAELLPAIGRVLGPEHSETLAARGNLARWTGRAGDPAGARNQYASLVPVLQRVLGPEHRYSLAARGKLARWTGEASDPAGARDQCAELLPAIQRVLGPEHPYSLTTRHNLARWTGQAGDPAGARDQCAELLPAEEEILGPEHPYSLATRNNLAYWTGKAGDPAGAKDRCEKLLPTVEQVLGPEHPYSLNTWSNLARWTGEAGDPAGARDKYAELLPASERVLGPEHPETLAARHNLAHWTGKAGNAAGARDQFAELLPAIEKVRGRGTRATLRARAGLAGWTGEAGNPVLARDQFTDLVPVIERVFGREHPETLAARANLARWAGEAGDPAGARNQYALVVPVLERVLGPGHPETLAARSGLTYWTSKSKMIIGAY